MFTENRKPDQNTSSKKNCPCIVSLCADNIIQHQDGEQLFHCEKIQKTSKGHLYFPSYSAVSMVPSSFFFFSFYFMMKREKNLIDHNCH